jgi:hypothetical protein
MILRVTNWDRSYHIFDGESMGTDSDVLVDKIKVVLKIVLLLGVLNRLVNVVAVLSRIANDMQDDEYGSPRIPKKTGFDGVESS